MTFVYSSVVFHIYPYLRGNSIPSDRNYRSAVVTIWSAVKRGRLNLHLVLVWRHTTYDYMTLSVEMWIIALTLLDTELNGSVQLGGSLKENLLPRLQEAQQLLAILERGDYFNCTSYAPPVIKTA
ncbi:unnamed protein product [Porites lobata]|uniref:Uncharacterized protein n=1 Tax=Porites lobata TaxID=104759 RepID=A0ABN8QDJ5_9CNID|nr:unnamed protein product [Porites lobata]